jgi:hypothetical protein
MKKQIPGQRKEELLMKRLISLAITIIMALTLITPMVYAAPENLTLTVDVTKVGTVKPGDYIEVPIIVSNNPGMAAVTGLRISWDSDKLMYDDRLGTYNPGVTSSARRTWPYTVPAVYSEDGIFEGIGFVPPAEGTAKTDGSILFGFSATENSNINDTLVTLLLKVKDSVAPGTIDITLSITSIKTQNGVELPCSLVNGQITVIGSDPVLESIAVTTQPTKATYFVGEALSLTGMVVTAYYSDGSSRAVTGYTTVPANGATLNTAGLQTITVSYTEGGVTKTASTNVTVNAAVLESIAVTTPPTKATYFVGETLSLTGMVVTAYYSDGSSRAVTGYTTVPANGATLNTAALPTKTFTSA